MAWWHCLFYSLVYSYINLWNHQFLSCVASINIWKNVLSSPLLSGRDWNTNVQLCRKINPKWMSLLIQIYLINFDFLQPLKLCNWSKQHNRFIQETRTATNSERKLSLTVLVKKTTKLKHKQTITKKGYSGQSRLTCP